MTVHIIGAGIGGLTAALCCHHHGHDVRLYEKSGVLSEIGAGIQLPPNAMRVFQALGLETALRDVAVQPEYIEARMGRSGRAIFKIPLADYAVPRWGAPYLHIHRADYIAVLQQALMDRASSALKLGQTVIGYEPEGDGVTINFADGQTQTGEALIGADGIHSVIRAQMLGADAAQYTGNMAWRAVVPMSLLGDLAPARTACVWMGEGRHAVTYQLRGGELANFVGVVERPHWGDEAGGRESWMARGCKADLAADFSGWHPIIDNIITQSDDQALFRWALYDRAPLPCWTDGRAALLGDAAHPMLPFLAQGAAMAVEDAWQLAHELSQGPAVEAALKSYEAARKTRTAKAAAGSRANMKTFHKASRAAQLATYGPMWLAGHLAPSLIQRRMNWLYGYDVTAR